MRYPFLCTPIIAYLALSAASLNASNEPSPGAKLMAPPTVQYFDLADVRLGAGPFRDARERDRAYLLRLDADRLLHTFRLNVGLPSTAEPYGGWEGPAVELRGHSLGHYLSACALMVRSTGDSELKRRIDYIVGELAKCQASSPKAGFHEGYLSAYPESFIDRVETRQEVWAPWYTLHKIMAGLIDAHRLTGNAQALDVAIKMAGWIKFRVDHLTHEQMQASLQTEFGGMNDVLANLYSITGDKAHLQLAQAFDHTAIFGPLAEGKDALDQLHANTQIPKIIGAAREFELTGEPKYRMIAETFWERVAEHRSYVIGGHSDREHFFDVGDFAHHLSPETAETCNTYNMLKLTRALFAWQPGARTMDFYERGLYNHILASQDPAQGMFVYLMSLEPGHFKSYSTPEHSFWCCVGTGMENHAKYGDTIFAHDEHALFVNLFIPAEVVWVERGIKLRQETLFPEEDTTHLTWSCREPVELSLRIRQPAWSEGTLTVLINGKPERVENRPGSYAEVKRTWRDGDRVEVKLSLSLHTEMLPGTTDTVALLYGPIVLAGKLGSEDMPNPYVHDQLDQARFPEPIVPTFVTSKENWLTQVKMVSRSPLLFRTEGLAQPRDVLLAPFALVHHERSAVYWHLTSPSSWAGEQRAIATTEAEWAALRSSALDQVLVGDNASESAHHYVGESTETGRTDTGKLSGRSWRQAQKGNAFGYRLETKGANPITLVCAYGSRDIARTFELWVDDHKLASPQLDGRAPGEIFLQRYALPAEMTAGKQTITVKIQAGPKWDSATANVFGCALVAEKTK